MHTHISHPINLDRNHGTNTSTGHAINISQVNAGQHLVIIMVLTHRDQIGIFEDAETILEVLEQDVAKLSQDDKV